MHTVILRLEHGTVKGRIVIQYMVSLSIESALQQGLYNGHRRVAGTQVHIYFLHRLTFAITHNTSGIMKKLPFLQKL